MKEESKLITIAQFENEVDAELAKTALTDAGIEAVVFGEDLVSNMPIISPIHIDLQVFETDTERAKQILAEKHDKDFKDIGMKDEDGE